MTLVELSPPSVLVAGLTVHGVLVNDPQLAVNVYAADTFPVFLTVKVSIRARPRATAIDPFFGVTAGRNCVPLRMLYTTESETHALVSGSIILLTKSR